MTSQTDETTHIPHETASDVLQHNRAASETVDQEPPSRNPNRHLMTDFHADAVVYPSTEGLDRPLDMPFEVRRILLVFIAVACVVGIAVAYLVLDTTFNTAGREQAALEENLAKDVSLDLPDLTLYISMGDEEIVSALEATGATLYERTPIGTLSTGGFEVIKLTDDVSLEEAGVLYASGLSSLSASDAVELLNGSWDYTVSRDGGIDMYVWYADFASESLNAAVQAGIEGVGLGDELIVESGSDSSGNTYAAGTIETGGNTYNWRVSALELTEMYDISGIPEGSYFVGIRFTE